MITFTKSECYFYHVIKQKPPVSFRRDDARVSYSTLLFLLLKSTRRIRVRTFQLSTRRNTLRDRLSPRPWAVHQRNDKEDADQGHYRTRDLPAERSVQNVFEQLIHVRSFQVSRASIHVDQRVRS